jgi:hypothetical protein
LVFSPLLSEPLLASQACCGLLDIDTGYSVASPYDLINGRPDDVAQGLDLAVEVDEDRRDAASRRCVVAVAASRELGLGDSGVSTSTPARIRVNE